MRIFARFARSVRIALPGTLLSCGLSLAAGPAAATPIELEAALAPFGWMAAQAEWPCRYHGRFEQTRLLGTRKLPSSGRFYQDCDHGLLWRVERPIENVSIYAQRGNFLRLQRGGANGVRVSVIDGLAERRVGALLADLFAGDVAALDRDFSHAPHDDGGVRLTPRDATLGARLKAIVLSGDERTTHVQVLVPTDDGIHPLLEMTLYDFASAEPGDDCADLFDSRQVALDGCDALNYPARWLQRARERSR